MSIVVIDYGIGNIRSVVNAFNYNGEKVIISNNEKDILEADGVVLPGVGSFSQGMENLKKYNIIQPLTKYILEGKPLLGICLGMQLLFEKSHEFGETKGLCFIEGEVTKLKPQRQKCKLPNINWQQINQKDSILFKDIPSINYMYFVHSYACRVEDESFVISTTNYGDDTFCSTVNKGNIYGCQYHPEKSAEQGLILIKNFIEICYRKNQ